MKRYLLLLIIISSCSSSDNFHLNGNIKGLQKGTVILTKSMEGSEIVLDSVSLNGSSEFVLSCLLEEPEVLKIKLANAGVNNDEIEFFANNGITEFKTSLKRFGYDSKISGSTQQKKLEKFNQMMTKYKEENLSLIKNRIEYYSKEKELNIINDKLANLKKREMFFIINYSLNNADSEISPFIATKFLYDANKKYLDTIYKSLNQKVKESKYGLLLKERLTIEAIN